MKEEKPEDPEEPEEKEEEKEQKPNVTNRSYTLNVPRGGGNRDAQFTSITAAFAVIGVLWMSKTGAVQAVINWVRGQNTPAPTAGLSNPQAPVSPTNPPTTSSGVGRGVTGQ